MPRYLEVAKASQIPENGAICVKVEGKSIALFKLGGEIYALDDACPHEGGPLSEGSIANGEVECPWHMSRFDLKTGRVTMDPATEGVATYKLRVSEDRVEIEV